MSETCQDSCLARAGGESSDQTATIDCRRLPAPTSPLSGPRSDDPPGLEGRPWEISGRRRTVKSVDEVQQIRNQAVAMKAYAQQAKDTELETLAAEIKLGSAVRGGNKKELRGATLLSCPIWV